MEEERIAYKEGLTYICVADCGTQVTVNAAGTGGPLTCCGQPMRRGRVLRVAPRQPAASAEARAATPYRLYADEADFDAVVAGQQGKLVLAEFSAPWCGACKAMDPLLDEIVSERAGQVQVVEIDVDQSPALPQRFQVLSVPSIVFLRDGQVVGKLFGQVRKGKILEELERQVAGA